MTEKNEEEKINPSITETLIGIRQLRTINVYPLSIADQKKMTQSISETLKYFFEAEDKKAMSDDIAFVDFMIKTIVENLIEFIRAVTDYTQKRDAENLLKEITNDQAVALAGIIYNQNYETALKNVMSLFEKIRFTFLSERPLPPFVENTEVTDLNTSTGSPLETEDSLTGS